MGSVIQFEERALHSLRQRLGAAESANEDLVAFARGHSGAVAAIHRAVLAAIEADSFELLLETVTRRWPDQLGLDSVALALVVGGQAWRTDARGVEYLTPQIVERASHRLQQVELRAVERGHSLFGAEAGSVRAEALVRIDCGGAYGLLALGQHSDHRLDARHGAALLLFLGQSLGAIIRGWLTRTTD